MTAIRRLWRTPKRRSGQEIASISRYFSANKIKILNIEHNEYEHEYFRYKDKSRQDVHLIDVVVQDPVDEIEFKIPNLVQN